MSMLKELEVPEKIGKYEVGERVGRGTGGVVYKGYDPFIRRTVAIKVSNREASAAPEHSTTRQRTFFSEAHAAGKLQHPHIVSLYDAGREGQLNYIIMEYVDGDTLQKYGKNSGQRLSLERIVDIVFKCCKALDYSHSQGVIHRDIKPSNIMLTHQGDTKIMDFSIASMKSKDAAQDKKNSTVGTPNYMPPEQVLGKNIGPQSDLYSLAAVMWELVTGRLVYLGETVKEQFVKIIREPVPKLVDVRPDLPQELSDLMYKALAKRPEQRFQSGQEFAMALSKLFEQLRFMDREIVSSEHRTLLRNLDFFNDFTDKEIDEIMEASILIQSRKDDYIINEGDIDNCFYIIVKGSAGVQKSGTLLDTLREGDCFGEIGFLMKSKRTASIIAMSDMMLLKVNSLMMDQIPSDTQLLYYKAFVETLVYRLSITSARLSAMHGNSGGVAAK